MWFDRRVGIVVEGLLEALGYGKWKLVCGRKKEAKAVAGAL